MGDLRTGAADLVLGASCPGCGVPALTLCRRCALALAPDPTVWRPHAETPAGRLCVVAAGVNDGVLRRVLLAWKERGRFGLLDLLAHLLASAVAQVPGLERHVALVPVPTSRRSRRERGADVVAELTSAAAGLLRGVGLDVARAPLLGYARRTVDQSRLTAPERAVNLAGAMRAHPSPMLRGRQVVVVDDILTTGSTLAEATRALAHVGVPALGAAVVAATPPRS